MISDKPLTPETTAAAAQVAGMFNSLHKFLDSIKHADAKGDLLMTEHMRNAHTKIEEAGFWAVKHVLTFGMPKAPAANDEGESATPAADPLPAQNASGTEPA
jgi:hypothetical protein